MGTKNISLTEEAYDRLKAHKRADESFSDVVSRLTDETDDKMKGFGAWAGSDLRDAVEETSREFDEEFEDRQDALF